MDLLSIKETQSLLSDGAVVIDTRPSGIFVQGLIPGSIHIPDSDRFSEFADLLIEPEMKLLLVAEAGRENIIARNLIKTGFANLAGIVDGGYEAWVSAGGVKDIIIDITTEEFELDFNYDEFYLIDLRPVELYEADHVEYAENLSLSDVEDAVSDLNQDSMYYLYGESFEEAAFAGALFKRAGLHKLRVLNEGYEALRQTKVPIVKKKKNNTDANFSAN